MALRDTFLNMLGVSAPEVPKTDNSVFKSARDFLRYGNREKLYPDWSDVKMPDSDMYRGYSYAVIQKRSNKVATLAKNNLSTWAKPEVVDAFQDKDETVLHPYLKLIEDSTEFSEKQFWKNISIYLDLAGRYYLGVIRNQIVPSNPNLPVITTDATRFVLLNPYEIRRVIDKDKNVAGYIERKKDGRYREWPKHQIIEMRELNPFDPENSQWAMTDAAKEAVYTINQSSDYTRQSLHGNIEAPGIITTDVLLSDQDFANFRARVTQHQKGEPLFGNGTGAIKWDAMQIDLDKAALMDINEINRTTLFAVSGTSKTSLGIEQSGTTRETARVQSEQFVADTAQPRLEDIVDFLNLDYKKNYFNEYKKTGYYIEVKSAVGRDYDTEQKATALKQSQFQLAMQLMQAGYTEQSAYQFAEGEIDFGDLELEKGLDKPQNPENPGEEEGSNENSPNSPNNGPQSGSGAGDDNNTTSEQNSLETAENDAQDKDVLTTDLNELEPHSDLVENKTSEGENGLPFAHNHDGCTCEHDHKVEHFINEVQPEEGKEVKEAYDEFLTEIRALEKETINAVARKLTTNAFDESDIIGKRKKATITDKIKNAIRKYWWLLLPLFANNGMSKRNKEFGENIIFTFDNALQNKVINNADRVAKGHMDTILNDILEASNKVYTDILEGAAADLVVTAYRDNPEKFSAYFDHEPTRADALASIRKTDLLEQNRRIYDRANKMAFEGYERGKIVKAVRAEYKDISENRATLIARNETARAFGKSQFEADRQFLNAVGKLGQAYKIWYSRRPAGEQDKICPFCRELIEQSNINPVPFDKPFVEYGNSLEVIEDGKVKIFTADYEDIEGGTLHPNCSCGYKLVFKNAQGEFVKTLNGGSGSGNFGHSGRPGLVGGSGNGSGLARLTTSEWSEKMNRGELRESVSLLDETNFDYVIVPRLERMDIINEGEGISEENTKKNLDRMTSEEREALVNYTSEYNAGNSSEVNHYLRTGEGNESTKKAAELVSSALDKCSLGEDTVCFRGVEPKVLGPEAEKLGKQIRSAVKNGSSKQFKSMEQRLASLKGMEIQDKGCLSTSKFYDSKYSNLGMTMVIRAKKNDKACDIHSLSRYGQNRDQYSTMFGYSSSTMETEVLFAPNTKLKVKDAKLTDKGILVECETISDKTKNSLSGVELNGGKGSGNFGHAGREGEVGGSAKANYTSGEDLFNAKMDNKLEAFRNLTPEEQAVFCEKAMEMDYKDMPQDLANTDFQRISYALGIKDTPKTVGDKEFGEAIQNGEEEFFRAVKGNGSLTPTQVAERLYTGEYTYQGNGDYCDGTYFTPDWGAMEYYMGKSVDTSDTAVVRCSVSLDANIYYSGPREPFDAKMVSVMNTLEQKTGMKQNTARAVALLGAGYDGWSFISGGVNKEYLCMLNRKHLTVNRENFLAIKSEYEGGDDVE